jgi:aspartyl-tRNA(Asn)/glutamyl-tRNA(Gln) amidotransferase subunit B
MNDYRYFPEPDLAPIVITDERLEEIRSKMPVLPAELFVRFTKESGILEEHAVILTEDKAWADYFSDVCKLTNNHKAASNWIVSTLRGFVNDKGIDLNSLGLAPSRLAEIISLVDEGKISHSAAQNMIQIVIDNPELSVLKIAESNDLIQQQDSGAIQQLIDEVLSANKDKVEQYKKGKKGLLGLFVGEVMKKSKGSADPKIVNEILLKALS